MGKASEVVIQKLVTGVALRVPPKSDEIMNIYLNLLRPVVYEGLNTNQSRCSITWDHLSLVNFGCALER